MIRAAVHAMVFFDIDETLIDQRRAERCAAQGFWELHRDRLPHCSGPLELANQWRALREKHAPAFLHGGLSMAAQRRRRVQELFFPCAGTISDDEADRLFACFFEGYRAAWHVFDDVTPCLKALRENGWRLGVISNGDGQQQREKLHVAGIVDTFNVIAISSEVGAAKPRAEIFRAACRAAGLRPDRCLHVGDRQDCDAKAALAAGMRGVWLDRLNAGAIGAYERITSLAQLTAMLLDGDVDERSFSGQWDQRALSPAARPA